jgi:tetratricopeptide (TPR) repeat protein
MVADDPVKSHYELAQTHVAAGREAEAIDAYAHVLLLDPSPIRARAARGLAHHRLGDHVRAIEDFDEVLRQSPQWKGAHIAYYSRALSRWALGNPEEAVSDCTESLRSKPDEIDALYLRGICLKATDQLDAAVEDFTRILRLDPSDYKAYLARAKIHHGRGDWEHAIADFTGFLQSFPNTQDGTRSDTDSREPSLSRRCRVRPWPR